MRKGVKGGAKYNRKSGVKDYKKKINKSIFYFIKYKI